MSRTLERSIARREYTRFAKQWRDEKRAAGVYGQSGHRRPSFNEWYHMHQKDLEMMRESAPADVLEYLGHDPWVESRGPAMPSDDGSKEERGVMTIDIATGGEERDG
jgi:hypothetical protein